MVKKSYAIDASVFYLKVFIYYTMLSVRVLGHD